MMRASVLMFFCAVLLGCNGNKKSTDNNAISDSAKMKATEVVGTETAPDVLVPDAEETSEIPMIVAEKAGPPDIPETLYARIERTACYGSCPIYEANFYANGNATLQAKKYMPMEGFFTASVSQEALEKLYARAQDIDYFSLEHEYDAPVSDVPSTLTVLQANGNSHWIMSRFNMPDELREFEKYFHEWVMSLDWQAQEAE